MRDERYFEIRELKYETKNESKNKLKLTTEVISSPGVDGDASALTGRDIDSHSITDCSMVALILTRIIHTVLQVRSRVHMVVTIFERPCLVSNNTTVLLGLVLFRLGV